MDGQNNMAPGARRNEDIALDLMKYVADTTGVARQTVPSTGFSGAPASRQEDHVTQLLDLYGRCLQVVAGSGSQKEAAR